MVKELFPLNPPLVHIVCLHNCFKLINGPFWQINKHSKLDFCPRQARKAFAQLEVGSSVNSIQTKGANYANHITICLRTSKPNDIPV